jgi:uncharacterized tellurite resistance protein B-like protein
MNRLQLLKNLVVMAVIDGSVGEHELALLSQRCAQWGLSEKELHEAISFALSDQAALHLPSDLSENRESILTDLLQMMAADGHLSESEKRLFALAAAKLGMEKDELNDLISHVVRSKTKSNTNQS